MTNIFRLALLGLCVVFSVTILAELIFTMPADMGSSDAPEATHRQIKQPGAKKADLMVAEILKRPLFTQGREPPELKVVKAEPPKLQGRLAGVMLRPDLREALFTRPGGRPMAVKEGDVIDGWTVSTIELGRVVLTSAFGEQVVKPTNGTPEEIGAAKPRAAVKKAAPTQPKPAVSVTQPRKAALPVQLTQTVARAGSTGP